MRALMAGLPIFRLPEHIRRLFDSAKINLIDIPFSPEEIEAAILESLRRNNLAEGYIRPLVFIGDGCHGACIRVTTRFGSP